MKKMCIFFLLTALLLLTACQARTDPSGSGNGTQEAQFGGSHTTRYPQEGGDGSEMYGPRGEQVPWLTEDAAKIYLKQQGAVGDGQADDTAALKNALSSLQQGGFVYLEKGVYRLTADVTVPENITLVFAGGAVLAPDKKVTVKITGFVDADIRQIFAGDGKIEGIIRNAGYPQWFGTTEGEDAFMAFQASFDALQEVIVPGYADYIVSNLRITHPLRVSGQGKKQVRLILHDKSTRLFDIRSSDVCIENFEIEGNKIEDSTILYFNTAEGDLRRITVSAIHARNTGFFLRDAETNGEHIVCDVNLLELRVDHARCIGYHLTDFRTGLRLNNVQVQNLGASFKVDDPGMLFCNIEDMYMADIDVTGGSEQECKGNAIMFKNCSNVTLDRAMIEAANGHHLYMEGCKTFSINQWVSGEWNDTSVRMIDCTDIQSNLMLIIGNNYPGSLFPKEQHSPDAMHLTNCRNVVFNGLDIQRFFGNGMIVEDSHSVVVNTLVGWTNVGNTFEERGSSNGNIINGLTVWECQGKSVILKGSSSKVLGAILNNGIFEKELVGPCEK